MIPELGSAKDPIGIRDYMCDWSSTLAAGETLATSVWSINPADFGDNPLVVVNSQIDSTNKIAQVFLGGGERGSFYEVINEITTTANPTADRQRFILFIQER